MYQEIEHTAIAQNTTVVAHITLDTNLTVLSCSPNFHQWAGIEPKDAIGHWLTDLFPQLEPGKDDIINSVIIANEAFIYHNAHFAQENNPHRLFDLQIEMLPSIPDKLLLTVIPLTSSVPINDQTGIVSLARHNRELLLLNRASQILTATVNSAEVLEKVLQVTAQIINAAGSSVWLWEGENQEYLVCRAAFHPGKDDRLIGMKVASGQGIVGWVAQAQEGTIVPEPAKDNRFYPDIDKNSNFITTSILAVPIHLRNRSLGVLEVVNKRDNNFTNKDLTYAEMLAASAAIAIDNAHLIETLQQKMGDLKVQNEELAAFDHTVAHDLQNPLALVVGFADLLQAKGEAISVQEREHALDLLVQNVHRMSNIIQELLMLSSVRKSEVETHPLDMDEVVKGALERLRFMIQQYEAKITLPKSWPVARGYAPWIEEVWENYIGNALKYGGEPPVLELGSTPLADGRIQFWVRDNGQGISPQDQDLLFTPFTKLSEVRVTGHGLGLSIVCRIMKKLGGDVGVVSQLGAGSTFHFILPAYQQGEP